MITIIFLIATGWPLAPMDSTHPLLQNYGQYWQFAGPRFLHSGIDVAPDTIGQAVYAVQPGVVKAWFTGAGQYHWGLGVADYETTDSVEGWLYWHLDTARYHKELGDPVAEGELIGYLVEWPITGADHVHFSRVKDSGAVWPYLDMLFIDNPLNIITPYDDTTKPVFENAYGSWKFAFLENNTNYYLFPPDSLYGSVDIVAKIYDDTGFPLPNPIWERLAPYEIEYEIHGQQSLPTTLSFTFSGFLDWADTVVVDVIYEDSPPCNTLGNFNYRDFFFIVTNTDEDSVVEPSDTAFAWVTTDFPDGDYWVVVTAYDAAGNYEKDSMLVTVANYGIEEQGTVAPSSYLSLMSNPIDHSTTVRFVLPHAGHSSLKVYNTMGQEVASLVDKELQAGEHSVIFAPEGLPGNVYFLRLQAGDYSATEKLVLIK